VSVQTVHVEQVDWIDPPHTDKYYRVYVLPNGVEIREYARRGAENPQYQVKDHGSTHTATASAAKQIQAKQRKGYQDNYATARFQFDMDKWRGDPKVITNVCRAAMGGWDLEKGAGPDLLSQPYDAPEPASSPVGQTAVQAVDALAERAMGVITMSVTNADEAFVEFAKLQGEWTELEESVGKARSYLDTLEQLVTGI
jgi:predicted DNA-binding WGR domain protein